MPIDERMAIAAISSIVATCLLAWRFGGFMRKQTDKDKATRRAFKIPEDCDDQPN